MSTQPTLIAIYADESCLGNGRALDNPGGAGGLIELLHPRTGALTRRDYWISEPATTNNRMALRSAIEGLQKRSDQYAAWRLGCRRPWNCLYTRT